MCSGLECTELGEEDIFRKLLFVFLIQAGLSSCVYTTECSFVDSLISKEVESREMTDLHLQHCFVYLVKLVLRTRFHTKINLSLNYVSVGIFRCAHAPLESLEKPRPHSPNIWFGEAEADPSDKQSQREREYVLGGGVLPVAPNFISLAGCVCVVHGQC